MTVLVIKGGRKGARVRGEEGGKGKREKEEEEGEKWGKKVKGGRQKWGELSAIRNCMEGRSGNETTLNQRRKIAYLIQN